MRLGHVSLTQGYSLALGLVAAMTVASGVLLFSLIGSQRTTARVINVAGAQRMLSQRIAALVTEVSGRDAQGAAAARARLDAATRRMSAAHGYLTGTDGGSAGGGPASAPANGSAELRAAYFDPGAGLDSRVRGFLRDAAAFAADPDAADAASRIRAIRTDALGPLLTSLDDTVRLHEAAATAEIRLFQFAQAGVVAAVLALIAVEALLIFRPLARQTARHASTLLHEATHDGLTGVLNRRGLQAGLDRLLAQPAAASEGLGLLALDLDWFKEINERDGHGAGDAVLRAVGHRLMCHAKPGDLVARLGGDEFVVVLPAMRSRAALLDAAQHLQEALRQPVQFEGRLIRVGASLGGAAAPDDAATGALLLRAADHALMDAKRAQKGSIHIFAAEQRTQIERHQALSRSLTEGDLDGIFIELQPQCAAIGGEVCGYEALVRWDHPALGRVGPQEMLGVAAACGQSGAIAALVRRQAFAAMGELVAAGLPAPRIAVNLSAAELIRDDLLSGLAGQIAAAGLSPGMVELEITEDVLLDQVSETARATLLRLHGRGVRLALDDFGTGFASLTHLRLLPVSTLKIDKSFVRGVSGDKRSHQITRTMIGMAHGLDMQVVAEGVETPADLAAMQNLGADLVQGYLLGRPMRLEPLMQWLRGRQPVAEVLPFSRQGNA